MEELASALAECKGNSAHSEMIRRLRLGNLRTLFRDRYGAVLPDDDAGREDLRELLLPISLGPHAAIKMANAIEVWAPWMDKKEAGAIIDQINLTPIYHRKPTALALGERQRVTNAERERLKLWTIAPCDMGQKGMDWWRKHKDKERKRRSRQLRGAKSQATSISRTRPWLELGIKRSAWYSQHRWTTSSEVKLTKAEDITVQAEKRRVSKESAEKEQSVLSVEHTSQAQKAEELVPDTALEINGRNCPEQSVDSGFEIKPNIWIDDWDGLPSDQETIDAHIAAWLSLAPYAVT